MIEDRISDLILEALQEQGYKLVKVVLQSLEKRKILQIFAERANYESLGINDCQKITTIVSEILDVEDIIRDRYNLEVSSPGLERPLINIEDYKKFDGFLISLKSKIVVDGSRKFRGRLKLDGEDITLLGEKGEVVIEISFSEVESAKIVVTDELIKTKGKFN